MITAHANTHAYTLVAQTSARAVDIDLTTSHHDDDDTWNPLTLMNSLSLSPMKMFPSPSKRAMSPVRRKPSGRST